MSKKSSYLNYLPPVLWENEPELPKCSLGGMLRIFEKILTGIPVDTRIVRVEASFVNAVSNRIQVASLAEAENFRAGDIITVEGTTERVTIDHIDATDIFLTGNLTGAFAGGVVRIADLFPGQRTFRVDDGRGLGSGSVIRIIQDQTTETAILDDFADEFVLLTTGLTNSFTMSDTNVPISIKDAISIVHGDHQHNSFETILDNLYQLFNPWTTPLEFLEWLASWVSLEFPRIKDEYLWNEYQRRKATSEIVQIYQHRGLKEGLDKFFDLYSVLEERPRIVIDDCSRVLFMKLPGDSIERIHTLLSQGPSVLYDSATKDYDKHHEGLVSPKCIAAGPDGSLFVGDSGTPGFWTPSIEEGVWRLLPPGHYDLGGTPPVPQRLGHSGWNLVSPVALMVDTENPWNLYVLDRVIGSGLTTLYRLVSPDFDTAIPLADKVSLRTTHPVAMALDSNGHILILDRGAGFGNPSATKVIDYDISAALSPTNPEVHTLSQVIEPLSFLVQPNGNFIIGDAREQDIAVPADLVHVDRTNPLNWVETRLFSDPAVDKPLVAPTAIVRQDDMQVIVLDVGLKSIRAPSTPFLRLLASQSAVYRVTIDPGPPPVVTRATRVSDDRQLVFPMGMVLMEGKLYICDAGEYSDPHFAGPIPRVWRSRAHEFGVIVHFPQYFATLQPQRRRIVNNILQIVESEKPAQSAPVVLYSV